jgi:hypothetical protein
MGQKSCFRFRRSLDHSYTTLPATNINSPHLVEPLLPSGVEVWQRAFHIFLSCARDRACLQSIPLSSNAFWMSCHLVLGLPLVLLPSYRASHAMRGYFDSGILTTWPNQRSCICWICDWRGFTFSAIRIVWLRTLSCLVFCSTLRSTWSQPPGFYCAALLLVSTTLHYKSEWVNILSGIHQH